MKISLDEFCRQWQYNGSGAAMCRHFEFQIFDFTTQAGDMSKDLFGQSFSQGGFYGSGKKWPARKSRWGLKRAHPVMNHTGLLRSTLSRDVKGEKFFIVQKAAPGQRAIYRKNARYGITVNPASQPMRGHRGVRRHGPNYYAAVHNANPATSGFFVNQWAAANNGRRPQRRQFIGLNKQVDARVATLYPMIFDGFPGI